MGALQQQQQQQGGGGLPPTGAVGAPNISPPGGGQPPPGAAQPPPGAAPPGAAPPGGGQPPPGGGQPPPQAQPANNPRAGTESLPMAKQPGAAGFKNMKVRDMSEQATAREQKEYDKAERAIATILYGKEEISNSIVKQIDPNDKIGSVAKASILLLKTVDEKLNLDEAVVPQLTMETVDRVIELAEKRHGINFEENEAQATLGSAWEGVMQVFGVDPNDIEDIAGQYTQGELSQLQTAQSDFLAGAQ